MKIIGGFLGCMVLFAILALALGAGGCANIVNPTGGPRDSLPPRLVTASPDNGSRHFSGNRITLTFDEFVEVKEKEKNIIVNPTPKSTPTIDYKLRVVTVKLRDSLEPNTTYSIHFGRAIRDVNEGNILKNFTYVFSTGGGIDSLRLSGRVVLAQTGKVDSTLIVVLHRNLADSAVTNERPRYVTTLDSLGNFTFENLAPGIYRVYALKDEGNTRKYTSKSQLFAFADSPVDLRSGVQPLSLYAYAEEKELRPGAKKTGQQPAPVQKLSDKDKRLQLQLNTTGTDFDILDTLSMQFVTPLKSFDSLKLHLSDEQFRPLVKYRLLWDSLRRKLTIFYPFAADMRYHIVAEKDFAEDTLGRKLLKNDTISFHGKKESDYGEVRLRFRNLDLGRNPVLLFVQNDAVKYAYPFHNREFQARLFRPGEYELRILYDDNKNGKWDPGEFYEKHRQPEKVFNVKILNSKHRFTVKANWDNDLDFSL